MKKILLLFIISQQLFSQNIEWINNTPVIRSYSSPRTTDLNNDGVDDVVMGGGVDGIETPYGIIAIDGANGNLIWNVETRDEMFTSPQFYDYTGDNINDVVIGGRDAELRLIDGSNGSVIWEFWEDENMNPNESGWYNFYSPQIITDQNGDSFPDILISNGGDHSLDASETDRPPGHIMIIDGLTGAQYKTAVVPDSNETYLSPILVDLNGDGNQKIIFGSGGETIMGNIWVAELTELLDEDLSNATPLIPNSELGYLAPPSIADLNADGILDIIIQGFDGQVSAINGIDLSLIWQYKIPNTESSASPIIGNFTNDDNSLDVFATIFSGTQSSYNDYYQVLINGVNGNELSKDSIGLIDFCSPIAFDSNLDGKDEVLISVINNNGQWFESELILIDFINNSQESLLGPIAGGNVACTPQITDIDNNGLLDLIFSIRGDSLNPFGDGTFYENGINTMRISTNYTLPESEVGWGSYMGTNFDGQYNNGCPGDLGLFAFPSEACPGENNAMINLYITGGIPPYTYLWSNGETTEDLENIGPGIYSVTVIDSEGICDVISREVSQYEPISFYQSPTCVGGSDGMVYFNSTGCDCNTSFCQFIWELNGDTIAQGDGSSATETYKYLFDIAAGTYLATIIHPDGCQLQQEITVPENYIINDYNISNDCYSNGSGSIELFPQDSSIVNYSWNTGDTTALITNLIEGTYTVIASDTTCIDTMNFNISNYNGILNIINGPENIEECNTSSIYSFEPPISILDYTIGISGSENNNWITSQILNNNGDTLIAMDITWLTEGNFSITQTSLTTPSECQEDALVININIGSCDPNTIIEEYSTINTLIDLNNNLTIEFNKTNSSHNIKIIDISGKTILSQHIENSQHTMALNKFQTGIYLLVVEDGEKRYSKKIILQP